MRNKSHCLTRGGWMICALMLFAISGCNEERATGPKDRTIQAALPIHQITTHAVDADAERWKTLRGGYADERLDCILRSPAEDNVDGAIIKAGRDENALYFLVQVEDRSVLNSGTPDTYWQGDCVELFLDTRPAIGEESLRGSQGYTKGVHQLLLVPPTPDGQPVRWTEADHGGGKLKELSIAGKQNASGYAIEIKIPFAALDISPQRLNEPIGIAMFVDDVDVTPRGISAPVAYSWQNRSGAAQDASLLGLAAKAEQLEAGPALEIYAPRIGGTPDRPTLIAGAVDENCRGESAELKVHGDGGRTTASDKLPSTFNVQERRSLGLQVLYREWNIASLPTGRYRAVVRSSGGELESPEVVFSIIDRIERYAVPDTVLPFNRKGYLSFTHEGTTWLINVNRVCPVIVAINTTTGACDIQNLPDDEMGWCAVMGPDGRIYIGTEEGSLLRYDPATRGLETLQKRNLGGIVMSLGFCGDRYLVFGAYPLQGGIYDWKEGKIVSVFNPVDTVAPESRYFQKVIPTPDAKVILVGFRPGPHFITIDLATKERQSRALDGIKGPMVQDAFFADDRTFAVCQSGELFLFDYPSFTARKTVTMPGAPLWLNGKLHAIKGKSNEIFAPKSADLSEWEPALGDVAKGLDGAWPIAGSGATFYSIIGENDTLLGYNSETREATRKPLQMRGQIRTHALCVVPEQHKIYGSPFLNQRFWEIDLDTRKSCDLGLAAAGGGQINDILWDSKLKRLFLASYTRCTINSYNPEEPSHFPDNPREITRIGEEQMRPNGPHAMVHDGSYLWLASSAEYEKLGGALSRIDPATGEKRVWRNIATDQNPNALVLDPQRKRIYASMDIRADQDSIKPTQKVAKLVAFDTENLQKVSETAPIESADSLMAFCLIEPGCVLVRAQHRLFLWYPDRNEFKDAGSEPGFLKDVINAGNGRIIASNEYQIGELVLRDGRFTMETLVPESGNFLQVHDGKLWYINKREVHGFMLPKMRK